MTIFLQKKCHHKISRRINHPPLVLKMILEESMIYKHIKGFEPVIGMERMKDNILKHKRTNGLRVRKNEPLKKLFLKLWKALQSTDSPKQALLQIQVSEKPVPAHRLYPGKEHKRNYYIHKGNDPNPTE